MIQINTQEESQPFLSTNYRCLAASFYVLLPTEHQTQEAFYVGSAQSPSSCFTQHFGKVSYHLGAGVYLGKLSGCSLKIELSENTWEGRLWVESSRRGNHHFAAGSVTSFHTMEILWPFSPGCLTSLSWGDCEWGAGERLSHEGLAIKPLCLFHENWLLNANLP